MVGYFFQIAEYSFKSSTIFMIIYYKVVDQSDTCVFVVSAKNVLEAQMRQIPELSLRCIDLQANC